MLISSHRHTKSDLEQWEELEAADLVHAERPVMIRHVERSLEAIREFAEAGPCYGSVSWGKDSTILADLIVGANARYGLDIPLVWLTYGAATNPLCYDVRDAFLEGQQVRYTEIDVGEDESMRDDYRPAVKAMGTDRYILGIRADESGVRRMSLRRLGLMTVHACRPLGWWKLPDVFAYLAWRGLPVHPNYAMLGGGRWPREHIRTASIGGERGVERGRRDWEIEYYGDVLRRMEARR